MPTTTFGGESAYLRCSSSQMSQINFSTTSTLFSLARPRYMLLPSHFQRSSKVHSTMPGLGKTSRPITRDGKWCWFGSQPSLFHIRQELWSSVPCRYLRRGEHSSSDVCLHQARALQRQAANKSTIATYGEQALTLNIGLRHPLWQVFLAADVTYPILEADFV